MSTHSTHLDLRHSPDFGGLFSTAFRLWWQYKVVFFLTSFAVIAPMTLSLYGFAPAFFVEVAGSGDDASLGAAGAFFVLFAILPVLITGAHLGAVVAAGQGRTPRSRVVLAQAGRRLSVMVIALVLYAIVLCLGLVALIVPGIWLAVACYFTVQIVAYDRTIGPVKSVRASYDLVRGHWWSTFGVLIVASILGEVFSSVADLLVAFDDTGQAVGFGLVLAYTLLYALGYSFTALVGTLLFFSLRARKQMTVPTPDGDQPGYGQPAPGPGPTFVRKGAPQPQPWGGASHTPAFPTASDNTPTEPSPDPGPDAAPPTSGGGGWSSSDGGGWGGGDGGGGGGDGGGA